ncbi:MAG: structural protein P5 [Alphaproteobacteria bacterium]|nr:structural protein P5 [Alphaproteobacteria bacterium]
MNPLFLPRGIRNNNPGNIRLSPTRWQGQKDVQLDTSFVEFAAPVWGLRAMMRLLLTYHVKYGLDTAESLINRWAPPHENATDHYIYSVARHLKKSRRDKLDIFDPAVMIALCEAITRHENGAPHAGEPPFWYAPALYAEAARMLPALHQNSANRKATT